MISTFFRIPKSASTSAAEADAAALAAAGLRFSWKKIQTGKRQAQVEGQGESMQLEWVADSDFRFFPTQRDGLLATERPIDVPDLHRRIRNMIEDAEDHQLDSKR